MKSVDISFIVPIYNTEIRDFEDCIQSIVCQKIENYEIILINDGTKDETLNKYYMSFSKAYENIKYIFQCNSGSAVARNNGIENANGEYIIFVDADDKIDKNFYKKAKKIILEECYDICCFDYSFLNTSGEEFFSLEQDMELTNEKSRILSNIMYTPNIFNDFLFGSIWGKCFSKKFLLQNNIRFVPRLRKAQDRMFMLESINSANRIIYFPIHMYKYKTNNESICHKMNYKMIEYYSSLYDEINNFCIMNKIEKSTYRFLEYSIMNELLPLTLFHIENKKKYKEIKKEFDLLYEKFKLKSALKEIKYKDIVSLKGKVKLACFKNKLTIILFVFFKIQGKKIKKNAFNKNEV